jgi:hypothetical protein
MAARRISAMRGDEIMARDAFEKMKGQRKALAYDLPRSFRTARSTSGSKTRLARNVATSSIRGGWRSPFGGAYRTGPGRFAGSGG